MKWLCFDQNNSGGSFILNSELGIGEVVFIEAVDAQDANFRAEQIGLYFNGVDDGIDCDCCGNRWYACYDDDGEDQPTRYGQVYGRTNVENSDYFAHPINGSFYSVSQLKG